MYIFSRFRKRLDVKEPHFTIYGTGSDGNSVLFKDEGILIDMGLSPNHYLNQDPLFFFNIKAICLTHIHGDHFNPGLFVRILKEYPHINFYCGKNMYTAMTNPEFMDKKNNDYNQKLYQKYQQRIHIISDNQSINLVDGTHLMYSPTEHGDITNYAISIANTKHTVLYATDLDETDSLPNLQYDIIFLEANYDPNLINLEALETYGQFRIEQNKRHLSEPKAFEYVEKHLKDNGMFIPLHASRTFGTLIQTDNGKEAQLDD